MNREPALNSTLHRVAIITAIVSLLPIVVGALVTTLNAGMAFPDWPTSDGHNMLTYPWLHSVGDKFIEHGHRLSGMLIGIMSLVFFGCALKLSRSRSLVVVSGLILAAVIGQGILGGTRVILDDRNLAMTHGHFAAWVFSLIVVARLMASRTWSGLNEVQPASGSGYLGHLLPLAVLTAIVVTLQYSLGGLLRHFGTALMSHLLFAFVVLAVVVVNAICVLMSRVTHLRWPAICQLSLAFLQVLLGGGAWITKYGYAPTGLVAVQHSPLQVAVRTTHAVVGMLLLATSVELTVRLMRIAMARKYRVSDPAADTVSVPSLSTEGGLA